MNGVLWRVLRTIALAGGVLCALLFFYQGKLMYHPRPYTAAERDEWRARGGKELVFETTQGRQTAFFLPPRGGGEPERWWFWISGNASVALTAAARLPEWDAEAGWLLVDFPGYGASEGLASPEAMRESLRGAAEALATQQGMALSTLTSKLGAAGHSLGAAAALMAAHELKLNRVVAIAPFTTMTEMGRLVVGLPLCYLNRHHYDNRKCLKILSDRGSAVWIVHGEADEVVPVAMGQELSERYPKVVHFRRIAQARHNDIFEMGAAEIAAAFREAIGR